MKKLLALAVLCAALVPHSASAHRASKPASQPVTWTRCVLHLDWRTMRHVNRRACSTYAMHKAHNRPLGIAVKRVRVSPHIVVVVRYPTFPAPVQPTPPIAAIMNVPVTGYSWGCGTPNGQTASGIVPYVGVVATGGTNDYLPFGTRIYVPSLGYHGIVEDRGQGEGGFDLFSPSCGYADSVIGNSVREVIVYGG